jgi:site-specific DNA-methyltransferase (adenine-specific)
MSYELHHGDCLEVLRGMADNSVDSIVTDPPYGLSFMGKKWDYDVPATDVWVECLRVLKPGGHLLAFAGTRTQHRMAVRIEDAGFEIRDMIAWVYGSGFPKSHNGDWGGTALKPALEPITVARKPLDGTVEANWREHGTGTLNIDACRVAHDEDLRDGAGGIPCRHDETTPRGRSGQVSAGQRYADAGGTNFAALPGPRGGAPEGRWPANLIHDGSDEVLAAFPQAPGQQGKSSDSQRTKANVYGDLSDNGKEYEPRDDSGNAARFFYCAKASRNDRNEGLHAFEAKLAGCMNMRNDAHAQANGLTFAYKQNTHPTVKPTDLMRYLCRLVTPPGGTVLDPFNGSGSTGKGAVLEGFQYIGIEREAEHIATSRARIEHALVLVAAGAEVLKPASARDAHTVDLFA